MPTDPGVERGRAGCLDLIGHARAMTLATGGKEPWTAPVYYLFRDGAFYFFSSPESRHIREGNGRRCAAAIFMDSEAVSQLRGIQMSGRVDTCPGGPGSAAAAFAYARRFGIQAAGTGIMEYFNTRYHARLYRFVPEDLFYMDNRLGFGSRIKIRL